MKRTRFLSWTFRVSPVIFVVIKAASFLPAAVLAAYMARRYPRLIKGLLRAVIVFYIALYLLGVFKIIHLPQ